MKAFFLLLFAFFSISLNAAETQKVVLISGSTGGIGKATALAFQQQGWIVWAGHRSHIPDELRGKENIRLVNLDVTDEQSVKDAIDAILQEHGRIDALINNAGFGLIGAEECVSIEEAKELFEVNFFGACRLTQAVLPAMRKARSGHIINISSTSGVRAVPGLGLYAASKFALEGFSESLAVTLSPWNIRVSLVEPGTVRNDWVHNCTISTNATNEPLYSALSKALYSKLSELAPQGQPCDEIGALIVAIAADENPHMRYQTSQKVQEALSKKLIDLTGDTMRDQQLIFFNSLLSP